MEANTTYKGGKIRRGWELTKSSWRVLNLDRELMTLPMLSLLVSIGVCIAILALVILATVGISTASGHENFHSTSGWPIVLIGIILYIAITIVGNFFSGALIFGATQRFRGEDPTVHSSLAGAWQKFRPLVAFSLMMATVGLLLQIAQERLPVAGKLVAWLGGAAWSIANVFAIPVIVLSEENVSPIAATKASIQVIRKVWGEGVVAQVGIGLIGMLSFASYIVLVALFGTFGSLLHVPSFVGATAFLAAVVGLLVLMVLFGTLGSIAKAALYHYASTGEAPELFNQELLRSAMTPKKARRIFG